MCDFFQESHLILDQQLWAFLKAFLPVKTGFCNEPGSQNRQSELMFPGTIFAGLEFIPTELIFGIFVAALYEIPVGFMSGHRF